MLTPSDQPTQTPRPTPSPIHHAVWYVLAVLVLAGGATLLAARSLQVPPPATALSNEQVAALCDAKKSTEEVDECYWRVALSSIDERICEKIDFRGTRNFCISSVAAAKKDPKICERIPPPEDDSYSARDSCILDIMKITGGPTECAQLYTTRGRDDCFLMIAKRSRDLSSCRMMTDLNRMMVECYNLFENQVRSIDDCAPWVNDWIFHDECLGIVARNTGDVSICDGLDNGNASDYRKEVCKGIAVPK